MESYEQELGKFWMPTCRSRRHWGNVDAMQLAVDHIKKLGDAVRRIGVEIGFLPADAEAVLREGLPDVEIVDALFPLERLRAGEDAGGARLSAEASERVVDSMLAVFASARHRA